MKLIAEPRDIGPADIRSDNPRRDGPSDQVPRYGSFLLEGDEGKLPDFAARISIRRPLQQARAQAWASVSITAHDGFNLNDLVSYNDKHNAANGEENRDGTPTISRGTTAWRDPPTIRDQGIARAPAAQSLGDAASRPGYAMILADEFSHTQAATTTPTRKTTR